MHGPRFFMFIFCDFMKYEYAVLTFYCPFTQEVQQLGIGHKTPRDASKQSEVNTINSLSLRSQTSVGARPVNWFPSIDNSLSRERFPKLVGISPISLLLSNANTVEKEMKL